MTRINVWIIALLASVLLNGLLIGAGAHRWLGGGGDYKYASRMDADVRGLDASRSFDPRRFMQSVPESYRDQFQNQMAEARPEIIQLWREARDKRQAALLLMMDEPFDPVAVTQALDEARQARQRMEQRAEALVLEIAQTLPADIRRQALLDARQGYGRDGGRRYRSRSDAPGAHPERHGAGPDEQRSRGQEPQ